MKLINQIKKEVKFSYGRSQVKRQGFWFVDIPRTSSTSIRIELGRCFGRSFGKANVFEKDYATKQIFDDHIPASQMRALLGKPLWDNIFTFTFVRNPWDRMVSLYEYRKKAKKIPSDWTFRDYILALSEIKNKNDHFRYHGFRLGAADYIRDVKGRIIVDFVGKFENRQDDLRTVADRLNCNTLGTLMLQGSKLCKRHYSEYYDEKTRYIIGKLYKNDIELFEYDFENSNRSLFRMRA